MSVVHPVPTAVIAMLFHLFANSDTFAAINTLGLGFIATYNRLGSLKQCLTNVPSISSNSNDTFENQFEVNIDFC